MAALPIERIDSGGSPGCSGVPMPRSSGTNHDCDLIACILKGNGGPCRHQSAIAGHFPLASSGMRCGAALCRPGTGLDYPLYEVRHLGPNNYFKSIIFSSDFELSKPDGKIFLERASKLRTEEINCPGKNDKLPSAKLGLTAMHIEEAWKYFKTEVDDNDRCNKC